jgi:SAM-dependent methyltransferase
VSAFADPEDAFTDREYHKTAPVPATGRRSIYEFRRPERDWVAHLFDHFVPLPRRGRVLDAGCGPGPYVRAARIRLGPDGVLVGLDLNAGRLRAIAPTDAAALVGDVAALPFPDCTFDVVLAMHMLYHVPNLPDAVRELRRVLRPGGVLYALTNSEHAQTELAALYRRHGGGEQAMADARFSNESGVDVLHVAFADRDVQLIEHRDSALVVTEAACIVDEFERLRYALEAGLQPGTTWEGLLAGVWQNATETIARDGAFHISENHGLFICRRT